MAARSPSSPPSDPPPDDVWRMMLAASDDLADEIGLGGHPFGPRSLPALDRWVGGREGPLDEDELDRLGFFLARLLVETYDGGLTRIRAQGHSLDGEWAVSGFTRGLAPDYHVPFMISAVRIGADRSLTARSWHAQVLAEGRG